MIPAPVSPPRQHRAVTVVALAALLLVPAVVIYRRGHRAPASSPPLSATPSSSNATGMKMSGSGAVKITPTQIAQFGITFGTVEQRTLTNDVRTVGTVMVDESRTTVITSKVGGYIERLYVNATGQPVRAGQPVAEVYSPDLVSAQEDLLVARSLERTVGENAVPGVPSSHGELLDAAKRRLRLLDISEAQIDDVLRTGHPRRTLTLYSRSNGVIVGKQVVQGQAIQAGTALFSVANLSDVWIDAQLRESDAGLVTVGSAANVEFAAYPGRTYKGRVDFIYPTLTEATRTSRARITVANSDGRLEPGMYGTVHVLAPTRLATTVPRAAVIQTGTRALVFVDMGGGKLMPQVVQIGRVVGDLAEVLSGLEVGQRVVTSAQFLIDSESNLGEVMRSMIGTGGGIQGTSGGDANGMDMNATKGADMRGMPGMAAPVTPERPPR